MLGCVHLRLPRIGSHRRYVRGVRVSVRSRRSNRLLRSISCCPPCSEGILLGWLVRLRLWVRWQLAGHVAWSRGQRGSRVWNDIALHYETWRWGIFSMGIILLSLNSGHLRVASNWSRPALGQWLPLIWALRRFLSRHRLALSFTESVTQLHNIWLVGVVRQKSQGCGNAALGCQQAGILTHLLSQKSPDSIGVQGLGELYSFAEDDNFLNQILERQGAAAVLSFCPASNQSLYIPCTDVAEAGLSPQEAVSFSFQTGSQEIAQGRELVWFSVSEDCS